MISVKHWENNDGFKPVRLRLTFLLGSWAAPASRCSLIPGVHRQGEAQNRWTWRLMKKSRREGNASTRRLLELEVLRLPYPRLCKQQNTVTATYTKQTQPLALLGWERCSNVERGKCIHKEFTHNRNGTPNIRHRERKAAEFEHVLLRRPHLLTARPRHWHPGLVHSASSDYCEPH